MESVFCGYGRSAQGTFWNAWLLHRLAEAVAVHCISQNQFKNISSTIAYSTRNHVCMIPLKRRPRLYWSYSWQYIDELQHCVAKKKQMTHQVVM